MTYTREHGTAESSPLSGQDEALVLLPGMLCDQDLWTDTLPYLPPNVDVIFGRLDDADSIAGMAQSVLTRAPGRFAVAGHSLGGIVALEMARLAPTRVSRMALLNTSALAASPGQRDAWARLLRRVADGQFEEIVGQQPRMLLPPHRTADRDLGERIMRMARSVGARSFTRQLKAQQARVDLRPSMAALHQPTLVIAGARDQVCPVTRQSELASELPHALERIPGCGHMSPMEAPKAVGELLRRWLGEPAIAAAPQAAGSRKPSGPDQVSSSPAPTITAGSGCPATAQGTDPRLTRSLSDGASDSS